LEFEDKTPDRRIFLKIQEQIKKQRQLQEEPEIGKERLTEEGKIILFQEFEPGNEPSFTNSKGLQSEQLVSSGDRFDKISTMVKQPGQSSKGLQSSLKLPKSARETNAHCLPTESPRQDVNMTDNKIFQRFSST